MKSHWVSHEGKRILYADFSYFGADLQSLRTEVTDVIDAMRDEKPGTLLTVSDLTATTSAGLPEVEGALIKLCLISRRGAIVGLANGRRSFTEMANRIVQQTHFQVFEQIDEAKHYVLADSPSDGGRRRATVYETIVPRRREMF